MPLLREVSAALFALALALASTAHAGGVNLSWNDCGEFGVAQRNFACDADAGVNVLYVSVYPPVDVPRLIGAEIDLCLATSGAVTSAWWNLQPLGCREGALNGAFDFRAGPFNCADPWQGLAAGGTTYSLDFAGLPNRSRMRGVVAIPNSVPVPAAVEQYLFKFEISNLKSIGAGSCPGCLDGMNIQLGSVKLFQPAGVGDHLITNPAWRSHVYWQPAGVFAPACTGGTPARNPTWGAVKSLYR